MAGTSTVMCSATRSIPPTAPSRLRTASVCCGSCLGEADPSFRLNEEALNLLKQLGLAHKWRQKLTRLLPHEQEWKESQLDEWLDQHLPTLGTKRRKLLKDSLAIAAYHTRYRSACPVVELLVCDDAPQFRWLTAELALCWVGLTSLTTRS